MIHRLGWGGSPLWKRLSLGSHSARVSLWGLIVGLAMTGCSDVSPVRGGNVGRVTVGGQPWSEVQVTIYRGPANDALKLGFGVTTADGKVELLADEATGPLWLVPGDYLATAESIGPPLEIAPACRDVTKTPLRFTIGGDQDEFSLDVPVVAGRK